MISLKSNCGLLLDCSKFSSTVGCHTVCLCILWLSYIIVIFKNKREKKHIVTFNVKMLFKLWKSIVYIYVITASEITKNVLT